MAEGLPIIGHAVVARRAYLLHVLTQRPRRIDHKQERAPDLRQLLLRVCPRVEL